jgi:hypothetical protein
MFVHRNTAMQAVSAYFSPVKKVRLWSFVAENTGPFSWDYCMNYQKIWWLSGDLVHDGLVLQFRMKENFGNYGCKLG